MAKPDFDEWLVAEGHCSLEVTGYNPRTGVSKKFSPEELREILAFLIEIEKTPGELHKREADFKEMGLSPSWYDPPQIPIKPLYTAQVGPHTRIGYTLKELLREARRAGDPKHRTVFVVDDDDTMREMMDFILRKEGFTVDNYSNGVDAVQSILNKLPDAPDLIILDMMMPVKSGYEIIRDLQDQQTRRIPVIVVTGRQMDRHLIDNLRAEGNVRDFLPKPFSPAVLGKTAHHILKTRRGR